MPDGLTRSKRGGGSPPSVWQAVKDSTVDAALVVMWAARWAASVVGFTSDRTNVAGETSADASAPSQRKRTLRWPADWHGEPYGVMKDATADFPCIGENCAARDAWYETGTRSRAYRDTERCLGHACSWQRMCEQCSDSGARLWQPVPAAGSETAC